MRVMALIPPIERHVGHWACSTPSLEVGRVLMDERAENAILECWRRLQPEAVAIVGREPEAYHAVLDRLALPPVPRVYRTQNTNLGGGEMDREALRACANHWARSAAGGRFALVLVQTLSDVETFRRALAPAEVAWCPYGIDESVFPSHAPEDSAEIDVGCYFRLKNLDGRKALVETAAGICARRGWRFRFSDNVWGRDYAALIRGTAVCLHYSKCGDVPFRLVEVTSQDRLFLTDPLSQGIEHLYREGEEFLTYRRDLSDLEEALVRVFDDPLMRARVAAAGWRKAREFTWTAVAERHVAPALRHLLEKQYA